MRQVIPCCFLQDTCKNPLSYLISISSTRYFQVGRSFFSEPTDPISLGEGCEIWYGAYKSIRPTQSGMMINIDYASTAFYKTQHVMDFLVETLGRRNYPRTLTDSERLRFQKSVKGWKSPFLKKFF